MAFALVTGPHQQTIPADWTGFTFTGDPSFTAGNSIVMFVACYGAAFDVTIDSATFGGQSLTNRGKSTQAGSGKGATVLTLDSITGSGSKTVVITPSSGVAVGMVVVYEVSGGDTSGIFDAANGASSASSANPSVSLTTVTDNAAIFAFTSTSGGEPTQGSGYTLTNLTNLDFEAGEYDLDAGSAGAKTVDFSASSGAWVIRAVSLKLASSPGTVALSGSASTSAQGTPALTLSVPL
jgi:hypothetical protein